MGKADLDGLLDAAVGAVGGTARPGQQQMAKAVAESLSQGDPLLVEAGTGTGKSLAYLVPAIAHALGRKERRVIVATATLALQRQLVAHDLPLISEALTPQLGRAPEFALLKGRNNYVCLNRINSGGDEEPEQDGLFNPKELSEMGRHVLRVREWAEESETGDRDELAPGVSDRVWSTVSVSSRECLGAGKCPFGQDCFAELARERARSADLVVTNHALLAIDTFDGEIKVLPEHNAVIIDEAHELVSRATGADSGELTVGLAERAARRCHRHIDDLTAQKLDLAAAEFGVELDETEPGRLTDLPEPLAAALSMLRDAARDAVSALGKNRDKTDEGTRRQAQAGAEQLFELADRILRHSEYDVVWLDRSERSTALRIAPLSVAQQLRHRLFARTPAILTSATLKIGGSFDALAGTLGLYPSERADRFEGERPDRTAMIEATADSGASDDSGEASDGSAEQSESADHPIPWQALDVGSPFDYPKQGILYTAKHLAAPGRELAEEQFAEIAELMAAAGGRTLGLFSSMRAADAAATEMRHRLDYLGYPILCQGEDSLPQLIQKFTEDPRACLFGTLSLWQGVNVPGTSCQLVIIDRIPFPRPDDPLANARQEAVAKAGGNGFMAVAAAHAALLLAQGAGRLIRAHEDRGVVAILDSRIATARYGNFLRAGLPGFWPTTDPQTAYSALRRLDEAAKELEKDQPAKAE
ncbi:ATP-dependent DNA helicase [Actinospica sp.]|uniref:ATP-dependent DNA helicase n=1 Tax=Actinospica sp. TaxID=1872142 RepID=UPI002C74DF1A|nr:ATP-dependent DNA helicase [Actinospica sp.]HWG25097.1 ATP-dependent DNA helicase [Actinospica sp.]